MEGGEGEGRQCLVIVVQMFFGKPPQFLIL